MDDLFGRGSGTSDADAHEHDVPQWAEQLVRTVAHLAAQLTMTQIRLRALASEASAADAVATDRVQARLTEIAAADTGTYLRENLGEALIELIDIDALEHEIVTFLSTPVAEH
jgi:hypothetical protein